VVRVKFGSRLSSGSWGIIVMIRNQTIW